MILVNTPVASDRHRSSFRLSPVSIPRARRQEVALHERVEATLLTCAFVTLAGSTTMLRVMLLSAVLAAASATRLESLRLRGGQQACTVR